MERIPEPEAINDREDVLAYDRIVQATFGWMEKIQIKETLRFLRATAGKECKILDIGCGTGRLAVGVVKRKPGCRFFLVDFSLTMLEVASKNIQKNSVSHRVFLSQADGKCLPFNDKTFDAVICVHVLHHLKNPAEVLREIGRVVKDDGAIAIVDLIRPSSRLVTKLVVCSLGVFYDKVMKLGYYNSLNAAFTPEEYSQMLKEAGLKKCKFSIIFPHHCKIIKTAGNSG